MIIKTLMVVTLMSWRRIRGGYAEYEELSGKRKDCYRLQSEMVEAICIPQLDKSSKVKEMFTMFGDMVERFQENELGTPMANAEAALNNCIQTKSEWGIQYWSNVLAYLLRQSGGCTNEGFR